MVEIILIGEEIQGKEPVVIKGKCGIAMAMDENNDAKALLVGSGNPIGIACELGTTCRAIISGLCGKDKALEGVLTGVFRHAFRNPEDYAETTIQNKR